MIDRSQLLAILSSVDTGKLLKALAMVEGGEQDIGESEGGYGDETGFQSWGDRDVRTEDPKKPDFVDAKRLMVKMPEMAPSEKVFRRGYEPEADDMGLGNYQYQNDILVGL